MLSSVDIINMGIGKYSATRIKRIDPGSTDLESFCGANYSTWLGSELAKRRWVFATIFDYVMTASSYDATKRRGYTFPLPADCMRPMRRKHDTWAQSERNLVSLDSTLTIDYVRKVTEADFDPLFVDVFAVRIAFETVTKVTESRTKKIDLATEYNTVVGDAARANAFVIGPESYDSGDDHYPYLSSRWGFGL